MNDRISSFTHQQIWQILSTYTFSAGNSDGTQRWYPNISFCIDGTLKNTEKSVGLHSWKFARDRINFYDKQGKLTQFSLFDSKKIRQDGIEMRLNFPNQPLTNYNLLFSDGLNTAPDFLPNEFVYGENHILSYGSLNPINFPYFYKAGKLKVDIGQKYLLSIQVKVEDVFTFGRDDDFFILSESASDIELFTGEQRYFSMNFENLTSNKWKHIEKELVFTSEYVTYGPYITGKGQVAFKNIDLRLL